MRKNILITILSIVLLFRFATSIYYFPLVSGRIYDLEINISKGRANILKKSSKDLREKTLGDVFYLEDGKYRGKFLINDIKKYDYYSFADFEVIEAEKIEENIFKKYFKNVVNRFLEDATPSFKNMVKAVTTGENHIYKDKLDKIRYIGISHIFAMSGLHIGIVIIIFSFIFSKINISKNIKNILLILLISIYFLSVEISPSLTRAYLMALFSLISSIIYGSYNIKKSFVLSAVVSLIIKPIWLFNISFQLSYLAMMGIFFLFPIFKKLNFINSKIIDYILFSFSIQLMLVPISIFTFGILNIYSFFTNLLMMPLATLFIYISYLGVFLENFHLGQFIYYPLEFIYKIFDFLIDFFYNFDFLSIEYYNEYVLYLYIFIFLFIFVGGNIKKNYENDKRRKKDRIYRKKV